MPVDSKAVKSKPKTKTDPKKTTKRTVSPNSKEFFNDSGSITPVKKKAAK